MEEEGLKRQVESSFSIIRENMYGSRTLAHEGDYTRQPLTLSKVLGDDIQNASLHFLSASLLSHPTNYFFSWKLLSITYFPTTTAKALKHPHSHCVYICVRTNPAASVLPNSKLHFISFYLNTVKKILFLKNAA